MSNPDEEARTKFLAARDSEANRDLHVIAERLDEVARLCQDFTTTHPDRCPCAFCSERDEFNDAIRGDVETVGRVVEVFHGLIDSSKYGLPDPTPTALANPWAG